MKIKDKIKAIVNGRTDLEKDSIEKIIYIAYYMGRESASKQVCDKANKIFTEQIQRAKGCRYHKTAMLIQGNVERIYSPDYSGDITDMFGFDKTDLFDK